MFCSEDHLLLFPLKIKDGAAVNKVYYSRAVENYFDVFTNILNQM